MPHNSHPSAVPQRRTAPITHHPTDSLHSCLKPGVFTVTPSPPIPKNVGKSWYSAIVLLGEVLWIGLLISLGIGSIGLLALGGFR